MTGTLYLLLGVKFARSMKGLLLALENFCGSEAQPARKKAIQVIQRASNVLNQVNLTL